jgi:hypothetical protein
MIGALGSPLGPHPESALATDIYSGNTPIANMDKSDRRITFNCLNESAISLSAVIGVSDSPLGLYPKSDLATDLYSGSIPIATMDEFDSRISFNRLNKSTISLSAVIGLSFRASSKKRSSYRSILWLYLDSYQG